MESKFRSDLITEDDGNGSTVILCAPLLYDSKVLNYSIEVPRGFRTDYASVPELFWNIIPKWGKSNRAAVVHDYLYQCGVGVDRGTADKVLKEALEVSGEPGWRVWAIYLAVRTGGHVAWAKDRSNAK